MLEKTVYVWTEGENGEKSPDTYRHFLRRIKVRLPKYRLIFRFSGNISSQYKIVLVSFPEDFEQNF